MLNDDVTREDRKHLPHSSGLDPNLSDRGGRGYSEVPGIGNLDSPTGKLGSIDLRELVDEWVRNLPLRVLGCRGIGVRRLCSPSVDVQVHLRLNAAHRQGRYRAAVRGAYPSQTDLSRSSWQ